MIPSASAQNYQTSGERQSTKFRTTVSRGLRGSDLRKNANNSSSLSALSTSQLIRETQAIVLQFPTEQVKEETGLCPRAIENQKNGESSMSLKAMINWCRANPRVRAEFMRLMGCDGETDPDFIQALNLLVQSRIRREAEVEPIDTGDVEPAPVVRDLLAGAKQ